MSERVNLLEAEIKRLNRTVTDQQYMLHHIAQMLGPKGRQVWVMWKKQGLCRIHVSWGPDIANMTGEEIADIHLALDEGLQ